jgi:hypothetical protein
MQFRMSYLPQKFALECWMIAVAFTLQVSAEVPRETDFIVGTTDTVKTKLIGYAGLAVGMPQEKALDLIRDSIDYSTHQSLQTFHCESVADFAARPFSRDALEYLSDLQLATGGLVLAPPWTMAFVAPRGSADGVKGFGNHDVFYFQKGVLVACARYPNVKGTSLKYVGSKSFQKPSSDLTQFDALLSKYGDPEYCGVTTTGNHAFREIGKYFQLIWRESSPHVGAVFERNSAKFVPHPGTLGVADRYTSLAAPQEILRRGVPVPVSLEEIDMSSAGPLQSAPSLVCCYYWSAETAQRIQEHFQNHTMQAARSNQKQRNEALQKTINDL